jgi:hypothetical protein
MNSKLEWNVPESEWRKIPTFFLERWEKYKGPLSKDSQDPGRGSQPSPREYLPELLAQEQFPLWKWMLKQVGGPEQVHWKT